MGRRLTSEQVSLLDNMCYGANEVGLGTIIKELQSGSTGTGAGGVGNTLEVEGAEIFNDYEANDTNVNYSHVEGYQSKGVIKAFHPQSCVQRDATHAELYLDSIEGITVGMHYNIFISANDIIERYRGVIIEVVSEFNGVVLEGQDISAGMANIVDSMPTGNTTIYNNLIVAGGTIGTFEITDFEPDLYEHGFSQHIEGSKAIAGISAHAEGVGTEALGFNSHAEGYYAKAYGERSHAEGYKTLADGNESHAEGLSCQATGEASHAEGSKSIASGDYAHAEGGGSIASGARAHAEGTSTKATGDYTHAEGWYSEANGHYSHAEGQSTIADGDYQHVQGRFNAPEANKAHIVGNGYNNNTRKNAHTLDWDGNAWFAGNVTINKKGHVTTLVDNEDLEAQVNSLSKDFGSQVNSLSTSLNTLSSSIVGKKSTGVDSVVFNSNTNRATNLHSFSQGDKCTASGEQSHAEGLQNTAKGNVSHAEGFQTNAEGTVSHTEGWGTNTKASYSHAEGRGTVANVMYQHVEGTYNKYEDADGKVLNYAHVVGNGSAANRSNAYTLDWKGNAWFAGEVTVGENNEKLVTESILSTIADKDLTNITEQGLINITLKEFGETDETTIVKFGGLIKKGQTIVDFKAYFSDGIRTKDDEYGGGTNEIVLASDMDGSDAFVISLPYTCKQDLFLYGAWFTHPNNEDYASAHVGNVELIVTGLNKIATEKYVKEQTEKLDNNIKQLNTVTNNGLAHIGSRNFDLVKINAQEMMMQAGDTIVDFDGDKNLPFEIFLSGAQSGAVTTLPYTVTNDCWLDVVFTYDEGVEPDGGYNTSGELYSVYIKQQPETIECSASELQAGDVIVDFIATGTKEGSEEVLELTNVNAVLEYFLMKPIGSDDTNNYMAFPSAIPKYNEVVGSSVYSEDGYRGSIHTYIVQRPFSNKLVTTVDIKKMEATIRDLTKRIKTLESLIQNS